MLCSCLSVLVCIDSWLWSQKVPRTTRTLSAPNESLSISVLSLSPHPVMPSLMCFAPSFQLMFGILSKPSRTPTCSWHVHAVAASSASRATRCVCCHTPLRAMLLCLHLVFVYSGPLLFGLGLELFTILSSLHQTASESWLRVAAPLPLSAGLCWL